MRKRSLGVIFFRPYVRRFWEIHFFWSTITVMPHMTIDHLWCPNGPEVNRKWTGSDRKWTGSGLEVDWKCPSVRPYVCPSQKLPLPPWQTLCKGSTSAGRLHPAIFYQTNLQKSTNSMEVFTMMCIKIFKRHCVFLASIFIRGQFINYIDQQGREGVAKFQQYYINKSTKGGKNSQNLST